MIKSGRDASNCWPSLIEGMYQSDPMVFNEMEKKLTLERFQREVCKLCRLINFMTQVIFF